MSFKFRFSPRYVPLSLPRRWIRDLLFFAAKSKTCGGSFVINVREVAEMRRSRQPRIGWAAIFVKAIALAARRHPELKQAYMPLPWGHFYQHPFSVASIVVEREWRGERAVFFDRIRAPETKSLRELDCVLRGLKERPVETVGGYRLLIRVARFPLPIRRLLWRIVLYGSGRARARYIGTFSVNSIPARNVVTTQSMTLPTVSLFFGVVDRKGDIPIQLFVNHYVIDGSQTHRLILALGDTLRREILAELSSESESPPAPLAASQNRGDSIPRNRDDPSATLPS